VAQRLFVGDANTEAMTFDPTEPELDAEAASARVDEAIADHEVVLFMKGDELMPQCGYSERALGLVRQYRDDVEIVDVLQHLDAFRDALESHSGWETIPQTFVDGEFVGGSDILAEHEERGDLAETLDAPDAAGDAPASTDDAEAPF
jgi:monothiol glutaredoxin